MFTYNGQCYDADTDFSELLRTCLRTGGPPVLPVELLLDVGLASLSGAAAGTPESHALASAALDLVEQSGPEVAEQLLGVTMVLAPRAVDRMLALPKDKWSALGGWRTLLDQLGRAAPDHPRFLPLLRRRACEADELAFCFPLLVRHDPEWLIAHLSELPRLPQITEPLLALYHLEPKFVAPYAAALRAAYPAELPRIKDTVVKWSNTQPERRAMLLEGGLLD